MIPETPEINSESLVDGDLFKDSSLNSQESTKEISFSPPPTSNAMNFVNATGNASSVKPMTSMGKTSKFGAVKVVKSVNFDEIEAKARVEREEADKRGLPNQISSMKLAAPLTKSPPISPISSSHSSSSSITSPKVILSKTKSTATPQKPEG